MNKYNLIETFIHDPNEYIRFIVQLKELIKANDEGTCFAKLEKLPNCMAYTVSYTHGNNKFIGDYLKHFRATKENIETFNKGCKILAERLEIYINTNDVNQVPEFPPAFGELTETDETKWPSN